MQCPYLLIHRIGFCTAGDGPYVPSLFELEEYCREFRHARCPFYLGIGPSGRAGTYRHVAAGADRS